MSASFITPGHVRAFQAVTSQMYGEVTLASCRINGEAGVAIVLMDHVGEGKVAVMPLFVAITPGRPDRFYQVNDAILAEALRQLLPIAAKALSAENRKSVALPIVRAKTALEMWVRQGRGRKALLQGEIFQELPPSDLPFIDDHDPGQIIPDGLESKARPSELPIRPASKRNGSAAKARRPRSPAP